MREQQQQGRWLLHGYRVTDGVTPALGPTANDLDIVIHRIIESDTPCSVSLPVVIAGAVPPHPDLSHVATAVAGVSKRLGRALPKINRRTLKRFREFVRLWVKKNLRPLSLSQTLSFSEWVMSRPYSLARKRDLIRKYIAVVRIDDPDKRYYELKCFVKDEFYGEYKHARGIYSRSDEFKCYTGPWFSAIEKVVFKLPWFIKYVPVHERAEHVRKALEQPGAKYMYTDYTAFESSFVAEFMEVCEFELYSYMVGDLADGSEWLKVIEQALLGEQKLNFRSFVARLRARRQSGEMCTSLGNGFSNLMIYLFACSEQGMLDDAVGFVEGDDGLFRCAYPERLESYFAQLGFSIKLGTTDDLSRASFCGMLYDTVNGAVVTDVREALCTFGWVAAKYRRASRKNLISLVRAKALSMAYSYPKCPMLSSFALNVLRLTSGVTNRDMVKWAQQTMNQYDLEVFFAALKHGVVDSPVSITARKLVEDEFRVPICLQIKFEEQMAAVQDLGAICSPALLACVPACWESNWMRYVSTSETRTGGEVDSANSVLRSIKDSTGRRVVRGRAAPAA